MRCYCSGVLVGLILTTAGAIGQEKSDKNSPVTKVDPNSIEVRFADESLVKMVLLHSSIEVVTRYGKLTVPASDIRRIEFGLRVPEETTKRIELAVNRLGSADFKQREAACAELLSLRELAFPALQQCVRSTDLEVARRAKDTLKTLVETVPAEKLHLPRYDTVVALEFTIIGQINAPVLKASTPYFGETNLKLAEVRQMRWLANEREASLVVDAGRYGSQQEAWMDTALEVRTGAGMQIAASGMVDLRPAPGEAGTYLVGPDGQSSRTARGGAGMGGAAGGFPAGGRGAIRGFGNVQSPGTLIGRIGEHGQSFVIGSRYDGSATEEGKLYLRIVPGSNSPESNGSYSVRIIMGR